MKLLQAVLFLVVAGTSPSIAQEGIGDPEAGHEIAGEACSDCHAIEAQEGISPTRDATPFQIVADTPGMNERALIAWMTSSHPTMPNLMLEVGELRDVVAYIVSLETGK